MSSNLNYKQVTNVKRRTWDIAVYEQKAKERQEQEAQSLDGNNRKRPQSAQATTTTEGSHSTNDNNVENSTDDNEKQEFIPAEAGAAGPMGSKRAFLKARSHRVVDIDSRIGTTEIISAEAAARTSSSQVNDGDDVDNAITKTGIGWHCKVCDCFLKDSHTYLDHINGRKHQRALGYSMRVERSTKDQLMGRLKSLTQEKEQQIQQQKQKEEKQALRMSKDNNKYDEQQEEEDDLYQEMVQRKDEQLKQLQEQKRQRRKEKKKKKKEQAKKAILEQQQQNEQEENDGQGQEEEQQQEEGDEDPSTMDMAAMMGFSGFGGGNKNG